MKRTNIVALAITMLLGAVSSSVFAWEWPTQMTIGGFSVANIRGSVNPDGSGNATGTLQMPGGAPRISLSRSASGQITGSLSLSARVYGVEVQGAFTLSDSGLLGRGVVLTSPRPIVDASISVGSGGAVNGSGHIQFGSLTLGAQFNFSGGSCSIKGSAPVAPQPQDTPLAVYKFDGQIALQCAGGAKLGVVANGTVQRTGKLSSQVSNFTVSNLQVNPSDGKGTCSVGGVSVTFKFF
jgi:hypothetical protein